MTTFDVGDHAPIIGSRMTAFGHSYLAGGGTTHADRQFVTLLGGLMRSDLRDLGVGGSQFSVDQLWQAQNKSAGGWAWCLQNVQPYGTAAPYTPTAWLPFLCQGLNDLLQHSHDGTGAPRTIFKTGLRTHLSRLCAARVFEDNDASVVLSGTTWQAAKLDTNKNSGTQYRPVPGNGAVFTITLPADFEGGSVAVGFTAWPAGDGQVNWTGTASQLPASTTMGGLAYAANGVSANANRDSSNGHVQRITGLVAADAGKTIIGTVAGCAGTTFATPAAPGALVVTGGVAGSYSYKRAYRTYNGDTLQSAAVSTAAGPTTLDSTHYNTVPVGPAWPAGVEAELIFRTVGGVAQGLIATLAAPAAVDDKALVATTYTANTTNPLTGGFAFDYWQIEANTPVSRGVICNLATLPTAHLAANSVTAADFTNYNADLTAVVGEFAANQWLIVDTDTALGANTLYFLASPNVHPNNRGHAILAQAIFTAIQAWAPTISIADQAIQSRVTKRVTARSQVIRQYDANMATDNGTDYVLGAAWADIDATNLNVFIDAQVGDDIEVVLSAMAFGNMTALIDVATCTAGGAVIRYISANTATPTTPSGQGWPSWNAIASAAAFQQINGSCILTVQLADLIVVNTVPGIVSLKLRGVGNGKTLYGGGASTSPALLLQVKNLGPRNTPGFNAS